MRTTEEMTDANLIFRAPSTSPAGSVTTFTPPSLDYLQGTWYIAYSTLPLWKDNKNVTITYTVLNDPPGAIDDLVRYQPIGSNKDKTVHGIDHPDPDVEAKYNWRGRGLLKIASSHWEVLGFGEEEGGWMVTYFSKTIFTPAGIDVYVRAKGDISSKLLESIKTEMGAVEDNDLRAMINDIFRVHHD